MQILKAILPGMAFGFFLQRARVVRYDRQMAGLKFEDFTIHKFMVSAIAVGMVLVYALKDMGQVELSVKPTRLAANILGGLTFGAGWSILGYCPGTAFGAAGEGRWDAISGILGMLTGATLFAAVYDKIKVINNWGDFGNITVPDVLKVNHWPVIGVFVAGVLGAFALLEKNNL